MCHVCHVTDRVEARESSGFGTPSPNRRISILMYINRGESCLCFDLHIETQAFIVNGLGLEFAFIIHDMIHTSGWNYRNTGHVKDHSMCEVSIYK